MSEIVLELKQIRKNFGNVAVLNGIDLLIEKGEFITFLGSSGCGKTTTLRIIAGLETPDTGNVLLNGEDVTNKEPNKRNVNTVFQNYALFPHMDVASNIGYGLKLKKLPKEEIRKKVTEALELVQLVGYEKRKPSELSGGQRQRVAIARAIVNNPQLLLLDEPLGALDAQLRRQMQLELKRLQKKLGITFIYITHDQEEAINMSDRIVVMNQGIFEQIGSPDDIYNYPRTSYVARFVGNANIIHGTVQEVSNRTTGSMAGIGTIQIGSEIAGVLPGRRRLVPNETAAIAVRGENILINEDGFCKIKAVVTEKTFAGGMLRMTMLLENQEEIIASRHGINYDIAVGENVLIGWKPEHAVPVEE